MNAVLTLVTGLGRLAIFSARTLGGLRSLWTNRHEVLTESVEVGVHSLALVALTSAFAASSLTLQGYVTFRHFGGQDLVGVFVSMATIRELGPVLAGAMAGAKYGAQSAGTLANMVLKEQVDALEVMSVNPFDYLVMPRVLAPMLMTPFLVLVANFVAMLIGGFYATQQLNITAGAYWDQAATFIASTDLVHGMIKGALFGLTIGLVSCYFGLHSQRSAEGVGRAINLTVVTNAVLIVLINAAMTEIIYG